MSTRPYAGRSADERRAARRAALLEAGLELAGTRGVPATTMTAVAAQAGLTERYFYESFGKLDDLLVAVVDAIAVQARDVVLRALAEAEADAGAKARAAIGAFVALLADDPRKGRVALQETAASPALLARRRAVLHGFGRLLADQTRAFYGRPTRDDERVELTSLVLVGGLAEALVAWLDGELDLPREALVEYCAELFVAAAGGSPPPAA